MNVLLLGNGFDIYYKLPTKYINFLNTVDFLRNNYSEDIKTISDVFSSLKLQEKDDFITECYTKHKETYDKTSLDDDKIKEIISLTKDNIWFKYLLKSFNKNVGWIDFEKEIAFVVKAFNELFKMSGIKIGFGNLFKSDDVKYIIKFFDFFYKKIQESGYFVGGPTHILKPEYIIEYPLGSKNQTINKDAVAKFLSKSLLDLATALKLYLECFVENSLDLLAKEKGFKLFEAVSPANLTITFNYTNTYEKLYSNNDSYHLHGNVNDQIVLGINPDESDEIETVDTSLISFKKYFQRTMYETDAEYLKWVGELTEDVDDYTLIIMGHSLDVTDKDIINEVFSNAENIYILYHDQKAKASYISNLVKIFGKDEFDKLRRKKQLTFLSQDGDFTDFASGTDDRNFAKTFEVYTY